MKLFSDRMKWRLGFLTLIIAAFLITAAIPAQAEIMVNINNKRINFDVPPMLLQGRTMVPLRGIFEELGATVQWNAPTRTIDAKRGSDEIQLSVGETRAYVNGNPVTLDVPPAIIDGRVLVPLRFVSEALGAEVKWKSSSQTVEIMSGSPSVPPPVPDQPGDLNIKAFTHNAKDPITIGESLVFHLEANPGGKAQVNIPGLNRPIEMREISSGVYSAGYALSNDTKVDGKIPEVEYIKAGTTLRAKAAYPIRVKIPVWGQPDPDKKDNPQEDGNDDGLFN